MSEAANEARREKRIVRLARLMVERDRLSDQVHAAHRFVNDEDARTARLLAYDVLLGRKELP